MSKMTAVDSDPQIDLPPPVQPRVLEPAPSAARMLLTVGLAFTAGALVAAAAAALWLGWGWKAIQASPIPVVAVSPSPRTTDQPGLTPLDANRQQILAARMAEMEARMGRVMLEADMAQSKAARAEHLLIAVAARRALDTGQPLGYLEEQLRQRFGDAQPRAVATIVNAARRPVTLADLLGGLEGVRPALLGQGPDAGWFDVIRAELSGLVTVRRAGSPSPQPEQRLLRARRYLAGGRVEAALAEVEALPSRAVADSWAQMARRYLEAHRALDLIETAAVLETDPRPRTIVDERAPQDGGNAAEAASE